MLQTDSTRSPSLPWFCRLNSKSQALTSIAEAKHRGFTLAPAVNWQSGQKGVALSHRFKAGTLKGSYAFDSQVAGLEYNFKPYKVPPRLTAYPSVYNLKR